MQNTQDEIKVEREEITDSLTEELAASSNEQPIEAGSTTVRSEDQEPLNMADDPYEFERCAITASVVWLPTDDHPAGRQMLVGVRNHIDAPILRVFREAELSLAQLPQVLETLLVELRAELPNRQVERSRRGAAEAQKKPSPPRRASTVPKLDTPSQASSGQPAKGQIPSPAQLNLFASLTQAPNQENPK